MNKITKKDLLEAAKIARNSTPCVGILRVRQGTYCILGCIVQAVARRKHKSFDYTAALFGSSSGIGVERALNELVGYTPDVMRKNDGHCLDTKGDVQEFRKWQVRTLLGLAKAAK